MEAAKQTRTAAELSKAFQVHPVQISQWKKHLLDNIESLFRDGRRRERDEGQARQAELFEQIGRLNMEPSSNRNGNRFAALRQVFRGQKRQRHGEVVRVVAKLVNRRMGWKSSH